jgi:hypothetical protein
MDKRTVDCEVDILLETLRKDLEPFITNKKPATWAELRDIIYKAVELDEEVHKSRALFAFNPFASANGSQMWGFDFDDFSMESEVGLEEGTPDMNVELVVAPFFIKAGTADGDAYETGLYLSKCIVVCTETRRKLERS